MLSICAQRCAKRCAQARVSIGSQAGVLGTTRRRTYHNVEIEAFSGLLDAQRAIFGYCRNRWSNAPIKSSDDVTTNQSNAQHEGAQTIDMNVRKLSTQTWANSRRRSSIPIPIQYCCKPLSENIHPVFSGSAAHPDGADVHSSALGNA